VLGQSRLQSTDSPTGRLSIAQHPDNETNEVLAVYNYSPFGLELGGSHQNQTLSFDYTFGGKEANAFAGLTDFGARWLDKPLGVWRQVDPLGEKYYPISSYTYVANNPILLTDTNGMEIDVSGMDVYAQVRLILSLSKITGNNISIKDGKLVNNGLSNSKEDYSKKAASYLDNLIGSNQTMYVNSVYDEGSYNKPNAGKTMVYLNTYDIEETTSTFGETQGWGLTFLHESLHTGWAANFIDKDNYDGFDDPPKPGEVGYDPKAIGATETVINGFRKELKLTERTSYFYKNNYDANGHFLNTTWSFGGNDVILQRLNSLNTSVKIMQHDLNSKLKNSVLQKIKRQ
jgi:RHS repeat-associated protein